MPLKVISTSTIAIAAGKGGVGKSSLTVLLAGALKRQGKRVGVLDADIYGPSLRQMLPEQRLPKQEGGKLYPAMAQGVQTLSFAYFNGEAAVRAPLANRLLGQFLQNAVWNAISCLLIDFPPGTGDIPITLAQAASLSGAIIVTTPQKVALLDVRKSIEMFKKMRVPILGIVENMSGSLFGSGGGLALSEEYGVPFLGSIPLDPSISRAADQGTLIELDFADSIAEKLEFNQKDPILSLALDDGKIVIDWEGGMRQTLEPAALQKKCPCAQCQAGNSVRDDVAFLNVERVGRYGLRFDFTSGCSYGIYDFALLQNGMLCENS